MSETQIPTDRPLEAGAVLAHYEVESVLGSGGMGTVYLARDTALERPVALKVLKPKVAEDASLIDRFFWSIVPAGTSNRRCSPTGLSPWSGVSTPWCRRPAAWRRRTEPGSSTVT
ncbi:MAG: hypothetical protein ACYTDX_05680 [Planctomycetota bacterium]